MKRGLLTTIAGAALLATLASPAFAADIDVPRMITTDTTWTAGNVYFLSQYHFVVAPAVLTIDPGTVIRGRPKANPGDEASALIITPGAKIMAQGTATEPIIFTAEGDNLAGNLGPDDTALWGGLIVLGKATINSRADDALVAAPVTDQIEGLAVSTSEEPLITFGGTDDDDNSGVIEYVSIRHGGAVLSTANEINGLSLGGVGRGTTIDHVEVFANKDDGVEFFGGTADLKYFVSAFGKDDGVDYDQGYRGRIQFACVIGGASTTEAMDKGGEWDGATSPLDATPQGGSEGIYNVTFIGNGPGGINNTAVNVRDSVTAKVYNSIFVQYNNMLLIENDANVDSTGNIPATTDRIDFKNNIWWSHVAANNNAAGFDALPTGDNAAFAEAFFTDTATFNNQIVDPGLRGISRTANGQLDPRPGTTSPALRGPFTTPPDDGFYTQVDYKGAFSPVGPTWLQGWTKLSTEGYLKQVADPLVAGSDQHFIDMSNRCYIGTGDALAIPAFVIGGTDPKTVLIRVIGTDGIGAGTVFGVQGTLDDPTLEVKLGDTTIYSNDDWGDADNAADIKTKAASLFAFTIPDGSRDACALLTLEPGSYTVLARGKNDTEGVVIVEVWAAN